MRDVFSSPLKVFLDFQLLFGRLNHDGEAAVRAGATSQGLGSTDSGGLGARFRTRRGYSGSWR